MMATKYFGFSDQLNCITLNVNRFRHRKNKEPFIEIEVDSEYAVSGYFEIPWSEFKAKVESAIKELETITDEER
jgi:hypothetical protein